jgi:signal transduction histidine kinase
MDRPWRLTIVPRTLRGRLILLCAGALTVAVAAFVGVTIALVDHELSSSLDGTLRARAEAVAQLAISAPAVLVQPGALDAPASTRQLTVEVLDGRGRILARSLTLGARLLPTGPLAARARLNGSPGFRTQTVDGRELRLYAAPIAQAGGPAAGGVVLVASDIGDINHTTHRLALLLALTGLGVAVAGAAAIGALTRRGLRPLAELVGAAEQIEATADPDRRLPAPPRGRFTPAPRELQGLNGVLNRMLSSLSRARAQERRFLADASHELRTPVTALLGNLDHAAAHGADRELLVELQGDAARLARLVDDLLVLERQHEGRHDATAVELDGVVEEAVRDLGDPARVRIGALEPVELTGDAVGLRRMVTNLVENGLVHGSGVVTVALRTAGDHAELVVGDEGPGPPPGERGLIFERFRRGTEAGGRPGAGLGLSIVVAVAERHGGAVAVDGATFTVRLPLR